MKNKLERILLSILLGLSVLLGLSFWLDTIFSFNLFCSAHWDDFAKLQASQTPIATGFYVSFGVAIFIFTAGIFLIYRSAIRHSHTQEQKASSTVTTPVQNTVTEKNEKNSTNEQSLLISRPPRLNLPKNMAQIAAQKTATKMEKPKEEKTENPYTPLVLEIFSNAGYTVKPNPKINGFTPTLFAIGNNEIVWIGGIDCDQDKLSNSVEKLQSVFQETLDDIPININAFILDTMNKYDQQTASVLIFHTIDELKEFIAEHPADEVDEDSKESFNSYSEYIDTIIQYIKNL